VKLPRKLTRILFVVIAGDGVCQLVEWLIEEALKPIQLELDVLNHELELLALRRSHRESCTLFAESPGLRAMGCTCDQGGGLDGA
jgi:hypothetical protein